MPGKKRSKKAARDVESGHDNDVLVALDSLNDDGSAGASAIEFGGGFPPAKGMEVRIDSAVIEKAKSSGRLQATFKLTSVNGEMAGQSDYKRDGLDSETSVGYFKGGLARLGVEASEDAKEWPVQLQELVGTFAAVTVKQKGDFTNIYFEKALDEDEVNVENLPDLDASGEETEEEEEVEWSKGDRCVVEIDGSKYPGKVVKLDDDTANIKFDDGDTGEFALSDLEAEEEEAEEEEAEEEEAEEEESSWSKGDRCVVEIDGEDYAGKIVKLTDDKASVKFDDGDSGEYDLDDLKAEEGEEEEEETEEEEEEAEGELTLKNDKVSKLQEKAITALAKANDFDVSDYDSMSELLIDIAEYNKVTGEFKDVEALLKKASKKA